MIWLRSAPYIYAAAAADAVVMTFCFRTGIIRRGSVRERPADWTCSASRQHLQQWRTLSLMLASGLVISMHPLKRNVYAT